MSAMRAFPEHTLLNMPIDAISRTDGGAIGTGHFRLWTKVVFVVFVGLEIEGVAFAADLV